MSGSGSPEFLWRIGESGPKRDSIKKVIQPEPEGSVDNTVSKSTETVEGAELESIIYTSLKFRGVEWDGREGGRSRLGMHALKSAVDRLGKPVQERDFKLVEKSVICTAIIDEINLRKPDRFSRADDAWVHSLTSLKQTTDTLINGGIRVVWRFSSTFTESGRTNSASRPCDALRTSSEYGAISYIPPLK